MKKGRFSEEQIIGILKRHEPGLKVADLAREYGSGEGTNLPIPGRQVRRHGGERSATLEEPGR
jgi:putative transposase